MGRVWRGMGILGAALALLVGGVVGVARAGRDAYACVSVVAADSGRERVYDLNTGLMLEHGPVLTPEPQPAVGHWPSPDGRWVAYARPTSLQAWPTYAIVIASGHSAPPTDDGAMHLTQTVGLLGAGWSPDGRQFAMLWRDDTSTVFLTTTAPDGSGRLDRQVANGANEVRFLGWSADGRFLATSAGLWSAGGESIQVWRAGDGTAVTAQLPTPALPLFEQETWSPVAARLAFLRISMDTPLARLVVLSPDEQPVEAGIDLPENAVGQRKKWSPDGARLALSFYEDADVHIAVYDLRDGALVQSGNAVIATRLVWPVSFDWSADSRSVIFWSDRRRARDVAAYRVDDGRIDLLVANVWAGPGDPLTADPDPEGGSRRVAVAFRTEDGTYAADVMDIDGANRARLFFNARTAGDAIWSPDGQIVLMRWTTQDGLSVQPWLTWARRDGSDIHHLQDVEGEYVEALWLPDGRQMAYVLSERGRIAVEVLDLEHNTRYQLVRGLDRVRRLEFDAATGELRFWWWDSRGESGADAFTRDPAGAWTRVYHYRLPDPLLIDYRLERAPSGPFAVFLPSYKESQWPIYLASDDGLWSRPLDAYAQDFVRAGWAADGSRLALVLDGLTLRAFDAQGEALHPSPLVGPFDGAPVLTRCEQSHTFN